MHLLQNVFKKYLLLTLINMPRAVQALGSWDRARQSTAEVNARRAYRDISRRFAITPGILAEADARELEDSLRVAGLYRNRSRVIKDLSQIRCRRGIGSPSKFEI